MQTTRLRDALGPISSHLPTWILAVSLLGGCGQRLETPDRSDARDSTDRESRTDTDRLEEIDSAPDRFETEGTDAETIGDRTVVADASEVDGTSEAVADPSPVRVALRVGDRPAPGATVVFHDGAGRVLGREMTDAEGRASRTVPDGSMVTYGFGGVGSEPIFRTVTDLRAGDSLEIRAADETPSPVGTVRVELPPDPPDVDRYEISLGCNTTSTRPGARVVEFDILDSCPDGGTEFDVLARAFDGDTPVAYAAERDVRRADGRDTRVELAAWNHDWVRTSVEIRDVPRSGLPIRARLDAGVDGQTFRIGENDVTVDGDGIGAAEFAVPPDLADTVAYRTGIWETDSGGQPHLMSILRGEVTDPTSAPIAVDLDDDLLPMLELVGILQQIPERPSINWVAHGDLSEADVGVAVFTWTDADGHKRQWHAYVPPTRESDVRFPRLPDLFASLAPTNSSSYKVGVAFVDRADLDGYADLRDDGTIEPLDDLADATRARITRLGFF